MARSGPILTLLTGMVVLVALVALSLNAFGRPPSAGGNSAARASPQESQTPEQPDATQPPDQGDAADQPDQPEATGQPEPTASAAPRANDDRADFAVRVRGTRGLLGISVRDGKAIAYFCDGKTEAWFQGTAADGELLLEGFGGASVTAAVSGGKATGELSIGAERWNFTAPTVRKPSGLYRATALVRGAKLVAGWIYLPNGRRVGLVTLDGEPIQAEIPDPGEPTLIRGKVITPQDADEFMGDS
jgi:hypothetical protein